MPIPRYNGTTLLNATVIIGLINCQSIYNKSDEISEVYALVINENLLTSNFSDKNTVGGRLQLNIHSIMQLRFRKKYVGVGILREDSLKCETYLHCYIWKISVRVAII